MNTHIIHWRWLALLLLVATLTSRSVPLVSSVILACGGVMAIRIGLGRWGHGPFVGGGTKETYWRGRRVDTPVRHMPRRISVERPPLVAIFYLGVGGVLVAATFMLLATMIRG